MGSGDKISVWKKKGTKKFLWWGRGDENLGWGVLGGGRGGLVLAFLSSKKLVASVGGWGCSKKS